MKTAVIRKAHFNAAHRLHNDDWSAEKNKDVFGKCNNPNYHGHNYDLEVKVVGEVNPDTGYVMDMKILKQFIKSEVTEIYDHKNLNLDVPDFKTTIPTAENIARAIYERLRVHITAPLELKIKLYETSRNFVEYPA
ncbi:MAG: 6-carboxytetrahydropterin synthase [Crocinitomicaceae bacterium]|jgi:6-pyruvoyltetrahydropterin/6-carboxytetrahydropterin synthase|nr:6-carboxytetrahydropterin synthase [bacterium]MDG1036026.1 6-carboxytetrahydropterin synthase [Crocinitomicaceae bacterium]MDG1741551.1 6-carboxytetrahydropterin synthase [Crocinitomicaceae bacterium]